MDGMSLIGRAVDRHYLEGLPDRSAQFCAGARSAGLNEFGGAGLGKLDGHQKLWYQRSEIGKPVRLCLKYDDGNRERNKVLLKSEVSIHRDEHIEVFRGQCQLLAVLDGCPTHLTSGLDIVTNDVTRQTPVNAFVE